MSVHADGTVTDVVGTVSAVWWVRVAAGSGDGGDGSGSAVMCVRADAGSGGGEGDCASACSAGANRCVIVTWTAEFGRRWLAFGQL